jgi:hypothetical protein
VDIQRGAVNRGLFFADPPPLLLGAVSGKISELKNMKIFEGLSNSKNMVFNVKKL